MKIIRIQFHRPLVLPLDGACTSLAITGGYTAEKKDHGVLIGAPDRSGKVVAHYYVPLASCYLQVEPEVAKAK